MKFYIGLLVLITGMVSFTKSAWTMEEKTPWVRASRKRTHDEATGDNEGAELLLGLKATKKRESSKKKGSSKKKESSKKKQKSKTPARRSNPRIAADKEIILPKPLQGYRRNIEQAESDDLLKAYIDYLQGIVVTQNLPTALNKAEEILDLFRRKNGSPSNPTPIHELPNPSPQSVLHQRDPETSLIEDPSHPLVFPSMIAQNKSAQELFELGCNTKIPAEAYDNFFQAMEEGHPEACAAWNRANIDLFAPGVESLAKLYFALGQELEEGTKLKQELDRAYFFYDKAMEVGYKQAQPFPKQYFEEFQKLQESSARSIHQGGGAVGRMMNSHERNVGPIIHQPAASTPIIPTQPRTRLQTNLVLQQGVNNFAKVIRLESGPTPKPRIGPPKNN